jgi:hypothetical protein
VGWRLWGAGVRFGYLASLLAHKGRPCGLGQRSAGSTLPKGNAKARPDSVCAGPRGAPVDGVRDEQRGDAAGAGGDGRRDRHVADERGAGGRRDLGHRPGVEAVPVLAAGFRVWAVISWPRARAGPRARATAVGRVGGWPRLQSRGPPPPARLGPGRASGCGGPRLRMKATSPSHHPNQRRNVPSTTRFALFSLYPRCGTPSTSKRPRRGPQKCVAMSDAWCLGGRGRAGPRSRGQSWGRATQRAAQRPRRVQGGR